jgi:hypothetical protein
MTESRKYRTLLVRWPRFGEILLPGKILRSDSNTSLTGGQIQEPEIRVHYTAVEQYILPNLLLSHFVSLVHKFSCANHVKISVELNQLWQESYPQTDVNSKSLLRNNTVRGIIET